MMNNLYVWACIWAFYSIHNLVCLTCVYSMRGNTGKFMQWNFTQPNILVGGRIFPFWIVSQYCLGVGHSSSKLSAEVSTSLLMLISVAADDSK